MTNTGAQTRRGPLRETNGGAALSRCGAGRKDKHVGILEHEGGRGDTSEQGVKQLQESVSRKASEGKKLRK